MNTTRDFIDQLVKIEELEPGCGDHGHYPFQMVTLRKDGKVELAALDLGGDVASCYNVFKKRVDEGATRVMMSLDFPPSGDIKKDFVCVFTAYGGAVKLVAIPYTLKNGKRHKEIRKSRTLETIKEQFSKIVFN